MPRADLLLVARGLAESRTAAQRLIAAGRVTTDQGPVTKPALDLPDSAGLFVQADPTDCFVSRGGLKLAGALQHTGLKVDGWRCLDVGQSTGGFSDCLLQAGAVQVVGVEVGHGQLHPRLQNLPQLVCIEGVNARVLSPADLGAHRPAVGFDLIVCDASFISLTLLLPRFPALLRAGGAVLALVKPQFEVGPEGLGKGGIVRDAGRYPAVEVRIREACASSGLAVDDYFASPLTGTDGNREFFVFARL